MALHVPRAPGFSNMLKDGARVWICFYDKFCDRLIGPSIPRETTLKSRSGIVSSIFDDFWDK